MLVCEYDAGDWEEGSIVSVVLGCQCLRVLKCGNENEATVACMGQGSCGAVMKLCSSY